MGSTLIEPSAIPGLTIQPGVIASAASKFTTAAGSVRDRGAAVVTTWSGLSAVYSAPESGTLLGVMTPVGTDTTALGDQITSIGSALSTLAETVEPIRAKLAEIKQRADTFVAQARGGITVDFWDSNHPAWDNGTIAGFMLTDIREMVPAHIEWDKYQPWIDENNALIAEVNTQVALLDEARAACVNKLNGLRTDVCVAPESAVTAEQLNAGGAELPWGASGNGDRSCYESVNDGIEEAFNGTVSGLGSLISYDSETGQWGDWQSAGSNWVQMAATLGAVVLIGPAIPLAANLAPKGSWAQGFAQNVLDRQVAVVEGLIGSPEAWQENPAKAAGAVGFNVGTLFIPGAGAVGGAAKAGLFGVRAAALVEHASLLLGKGGAAVLDAVGGAGTKVGSALTHLMDVMKIDGGSGLRFDKALADLEDTLKKADVDVNKSHIALGDGHGPNADGLDSGHGSSGKPDADGSGSDQPGSNGTEKDATPADRPDQSGSTPGDSNPGDHQPGDGTPGGSAAGDGGHPPLSDREFSALAPDDQFAVAQNEVAQGAKSFDNNLDAHQYGADRWNDYAENLPQDQKAALLDYSKDPPHNPSYREINGALRGSDPLTPEMARTIEAIDRALDGKSLNEALVVERGTDLTHLNLVDPTDMIGRTYGDPAYMSSSLGEAAFSNKEAILHLKVPAGTPAIYMEKVSHYGAGERELLLRRGSEYRVDRVILDDQGKWQVFGEVIVNE